MALQAIGVKSGHTLLLFFCIFYCFFLLVNVCLCCISFSFFHYQAKRLAGKNIFQNGLSSRALQLSLLSMVSVVNNVLTLRVVQCNLLCLLYADKTEQQQYALILKLTSTVLSPFQQSMLKFALTLRMYSPTVQMFHQVSLTHTNVSLLISVPFTRVHFIVHWCWCQRGNSARSSRSLVMDDERMRPGSLVEIRASVLQRYWLMTERICYLLKIPMSLPTKLLLQNNWKTKVNQLTFFNGKMSIGMEVDSTSVSIRCTVFFLFHAVFVSYMLKFYCLFFLIVSKMCLCVYLLQNSQLSLFYADS